MVEKDIYEIRKIANAAGPRFPTLGYYVCTGPEDEVTHEIYANQITEINYTGKPGTASGIYYSLFFQLPKWDWHAEKAAEWIEVMPTHKEYYDRTMATKQMLESTIKTGLASAAQAVADYELLMHDVRKYTEILGYFERDDHHSLKSMFIDQVDIHTGNLSVAEMTRNRWPTMTADFHSLKDEWVKHEKIKDELGVSTAEAIILITKNKLYVDWKNLFGKTVKERYERLRNMALSREKSVKEYKEWLKPYISRFRTTRLGTAQPGLRKFFTRTFMDATGLSTFLNILTFFAWKPLITREARRPSEEIKGKFKISPYDSFVRNNLILGGEFRTFTKTKAKDLPALGDIYQWLRNEKKYCAKCEEYSPSGFIKCENCGSVDLQDKTYADQLVEKDILPYWGKKWGTDPYEPYYMFLRCDIERLGIRLPSGELEDITFTNKMYVISQNILLIKILELMCREMELEMYIEEILGFKGTEKALGEILAEEHRKTFGRPKEELKGSAKFSKELKDAIRGSTGAFKKIKMPQTNFMFVKPGPYESTFRDRITKQYLAVSGSNFGQINSFIKSKMGMV